MRKNIAFAIATLLVLISICSVTSIGMDMEYSGHIDKASHAYSSHLAKCCVAVSSGMSVVTPFTISAFFAVMALSLIYVFTIPSILPVPLFRPPQ